MVVNDCVKTSVKAVEQIYHLENYKIEDNIAYTC